MTPRLRRLAWGIGLYAAGVSVLAGVTGVIRLALAAFIQ